MDPKPSSPPSRAEALFEKYLEQKRRGDRGSLENLCTNHPELADELRLRQRAWERAGKALAALQTAPSVPAQHFESLNTAAGLSWDRYTRQEEIGRGGMGLILRIRDEDFGRDLAMKVMRPRKQSFLKPDDGESSTRAEARFLEEARITGRLQHPNIVPVHEIGEDPDGQPFFTMKLVEGRTFREVIELARLSQDGWNQQRALSVLQQVCEAVGFAHDKGIVHRDLKPANLMVGSFGEVYVMDWGLARDFKKPEPETTPSQRSSEAHSDTPTQAYQTRDGDVLGTPEYMSPEQAAGQRSRVGPSSDIFAMGAILFELLTGQPPHGKPTPGPGFVRVAQALAAAPASVRELSPATPAELCAICERATEADPGQRYPTMVEFADDLRAYLEGRVVQAHATGTWAELRKWVQRNPVIAGLAATLVLTLGTGLAMISRKNAVLETQSAQLLQSNKDLQSRTEEAEVAQQEAQQRSEELERVTHYQASMLSNIDAHTMGLSLFATHRSSFEQHLAGLELGPAEAQAARVAIDGWLSSLNPTDVALGILDQSILGNAVDTIGEEFADQPLVEAQLRQSSASIYQDLGLYDAALVQFERVLELYAGKLGPQHRNTLRARNELGSLLQALGKPQEAEPYLRASYESALATLGREDELTLAFENNLALICKVLNRTQEAETLYKQTLASRREVLGEKHADTIGTISNLGALYSALGREEEALPFYEEALSGSREALGEDHEQTLSAYHNMGYLLKQMKRYEEAGQSILVALEGRRRILGDAHPDTLRSLANLGLVMKLMGEYERAQNYYAEALAGRRERLGSAHPETLLLLNNQAGLQKRLGDNEAALGLYLEAIAGATKALGPSHPNVLIYHNNAGTVLTLLERFEDAEKMQRIAAERGQESGDSGSPYLPQFKLNHARALIDLDRLEEAERVAGEALTLARNEERYAAVEPQALSVLATVAQKAGRWFEAESSLLAVIGLQTDRRGAGDDRTRQAVQKLIDFYGVWPATSAPEDLEVRLELWRTRLKQDSK